MKNSTIFLITILFLIGCEKEKIFPFNSNEIATTYKYGNGNWINGKDFADQINLNLGCEIYSKKDGYYRLRFEEQDLIYIADIYLDVYEIERNKYFDIRQYNFRIKENPYFTSGTGSIRVRPLSLPNPGNHLDLNLYSSNPDSTYSIQYRAKSR